MDLKKSIYLSNKVYIAKIYTQCWGDYDIGLFSKYYEPTVDAGGSFTSSYETFTLDNGLYSIKSNSPISKTFDTVSLGISYEYAGARALAWVEAVEGKIRTAMTVLRTLDSTSNAELDKTVVI